MEAAEVGRSDGSVVSVVRGPSSNVAAYPARFRSRIIAEMSSDKRFSYTPRSGVIVVVVVVVPGREQFSPPAEFPAITRVALIEFKRDRRTYRRRHDPSYSPAVYTENITTSVA